MKRSQKVPQERFSGGFEKNLIHSCLVLIAEYEITNDLIIFYKTHMTRKNLALDQRPTDQSQCRIL